jgi:serine protease Do
MLRGILILCLISLTSNASDPNRYSYADIVEPLIPAVVNISIMQKSDGSSENFPLDNPQFDELRKFFDNFGQMPSMEDDERPEGVRPTSAGSGFIISPEGHIVTNYHVIDDAEKITVTLANNKKYEAKIIGKDSRTDLALIKIDTKFKLPFVKFGDSDASRVGDFVIAIGNPFGLGSTVTAGIISSQARDIHTSSDNIIDNFIQTDASINRGNSGGPMFNMNGEVIGINVAIFSPTGGSVGVGFAVPSSVAKDVVGQLTKAGKVTRGWLGLMIQSTSDVAEGLGLDESVGALVSNVTTGGPADKAGVKVGDIILKFNDQDITDTKRLPRIVAETAIGNKINVEIMSNGKRKNIVLVIGEIDAAFQTPGIHPEQSRSLYGMGLSPLTEDVKNKLDVARNVSGVLVSKVESRSIASKHGIKSDDIINSVNQQNVANIGELFAAVEFAKKMKRKSVMLLIYRSGGIVFLTIPIQK